MYISPLRWSDAKLQGLIPCALFTLQPFHHYAGVAGFVVNDEGEVLLVQEKWIRRLGARHWKLPGGHAEKGRRNIICSSTLTSRATQRESTDYVRNAMELTKANCMAIHHWSSFHPYT